VEFVSDKMSYLTLKCRWCDIIVLNVHAPTEDKDDDIKERLYKALGGGGTLVRITTVIVTITTTIMIVVLISIKYLLHTSTRLKHGNCFPGSSRHPPICLVLTQFTTQTGIMYKQTIPF